VTRDALLVSQSLSIPRAELAFRASRSGGAGGQHVNTSSTRIELLWDLTHSASVTDAERERLLSKLASRLDAEGFVRVVASARRSQQQNREEAEERLAQLVRQALVVPKTRKKTKPGRVAKEKRLSEKRRHAERKQNRRQRDFD
jgi:ribosome-associated protein